MKRLGICCAIAFGLIASAAPRREAVVPRGQSHDLFGVTVLPRQVLGSMTSVWRRNNKHWNELQGENTLTQMLGTGKPTQHEFLGCLQGRIARDTLWIAGWVTARHLRQLQFAVAGDCDHVAGFVGTWHTHPFRADSLNHPLKERKLSSLDMETLTSDRDLVTMVMWDADSLDVAAKGPDGAIRHPASLVIR